MKLIQALIVIVVILVGGFFAINHFIYQEKQNDEQVVSDPRDGWYLVEGEWVHLENGVSRIPIAEDSASAVTTQYFGNEARGDFDGDGDEDVAFIMTQDGSGSGIFFYLALALKEDAGYRGMSTLFIGDRIAPQTTEYRNGRVIVNYADRAPDEAMAVLPHIGASLYAVYSADANGFVEVDPSFSGEATAGALAESFATRMFAAGTADGLIPIEGFDAGLLLAKFPGLTPNDFDGVQAFEGVYSVESGEVVFTRSQAQPVSSAERTVSAAGYETLLKNAAARLNVSMQTDFSIDAIVTALFGKGVGLAGLGEHAYIGGVVVTPEEVTEDSRCPSDAQCIWEGRLVVRTTVDAAEAVLTLGEAKTVGNRTVTLVQAKPYPEAGSEISSAAYEFTFTVEEN